MLLHLQIIPPELFEAAQHIRTSRANSAEQERRVPLNTRGQSLLAGNVFCGHCGSRLSLTTNGKAYPCKDDPNRIVKRVRYICYGKTRKQTECDGQTGYTAHTLDGIIDKVVRQIFERMKAVPKSEIVNIRYKEKMEERKALLRSIRAEHTKVSAELNMLKAEVIKSLRGESAFSQDLLGSLISDCETKCLEVQQQLEAAQLAYDEGQAVLEHLNAQYDDIISWADMYDTASMEAKKMIVNCLIKRVEVYRDYNVAYRLLTLTLSSSAWAWTSLPSLHKSKNPTSEEVRFSFHQSLGDGGDKRDRTADLLNAIQALSQLSYTPR